MGQHFEMAVGMMEAHDDVSQPYGSVVVDVTERTVTTASYRRVRDARPGRGVREERVEVDGLWLRTVGVDSMPRMTGWCDDEVRVAIAEFCQANCVELDDFFTWGNDDSLIGPDYGARFRAKHSLSSTP